MASTDRGAVNPAPTETQTAKTRSAECSCSPTGSRTRAAPSGVEGRQIPDLLASELGETLEIVARDARLDVRMTAAAAVACFNDIPSRLHGDCVGVQLGDLVAGQELTLVLAVTVPGLAEGATAAIECRTADRDQALFQGAMRVEWQAVAAAIDQAQPVNADVLREVARMIAERSRSRALDLNGEGKYDEARDFLKKAAVRLRELGAQIDEVERLAQELDREAEDFHAPMTAMARKAVHFTAYAASSSRAPDGTAKRRSSK